MFPCAGTDLRNHRGFRFNRPMGKAGKFLSVLLLPFLVLVAAAPTPQSGPKAAYPQSMAALGDSITQAHNACCTYGDQPAQSWSTGGGQGDGITSHYERLLQLTPGIKGHTFNNAVSGAKVSDLPRQAAAAVAQQVEYVTVLMGANDLCASSVDAMTPIEDFRTRLAEALTILDQARPRPQVAVSSIPNIYQLWSVLRDEPAAAAAWSAGRICQSMLAHSNTEQTRSQVVERELAFNAILTEVCGHYTNCRSDGGAVYNYNFSAADISVRDYFHPSLRGQAILAGITWNAAWERR